MKKNIAEPFDPSILVLFGATGHLSANFLLPAFHSMDSQGMLPESLKIICVGRRDFTTESFLNYIVEKSQFLQALSKGKVRKHFLKHLTYYAGDFSDAKSFEKLSKDLLDREKPAHQCYNRLYYFATAPEFFAPIARILKDSSLLTACEDHKRKIRVLVEKPFGSDLRSAKQLNKVLLQFFSEEQVYRIDHYLGKETVQNLMVVRFANQIFEPLWNAEAVDHIEISSLESDKVGERAAFYDEAGALKDVMQNHVLQMLALIAMEEPKELQTELIRDEKLKVLKSLVPFKDKELKNDIILGQYEGYEGEVQKKSRTETFVAMKVSLDLPRWKGVPVYLRAGKSLGKKITEISVHFKEPLKCLFENCAANVMIFRIQPDESVFLQINNKIPGFGVKLHQARLEFSYKQAFEKGLSSAYERLLLDFLQGDQRLFMRSDEIEAAWKFVDSITKNLAQIPLQKYKQGSNGPKEAEEFIAKDGREWFTQ